MLTRKLMNKKRARTKKGRYKGDNPSTPYKNEAYVNGGTSVLEGYSKTMRKFFTLY